MISEKLKMKNEKTQGSNSFPLLKACSAQEMSAWHYPRQFYLLYLMRNPMSNQLQHIKCWI